MDEGRNSKKEGATMMRLVLLGSFCAGWLVACGQHVSKRVTFRELRQAIWLHRGDATGPLECNRGVPKDRRFVWQIIHTHWSFTQPQLAGPSGTI